MRLILGAILILTFSSCSQLNPLGFLSSGVNTAANVQAGRTNTQTLGTTNNVDQRVSVEQAETVNQTNDTSRVKADSVETVVVNEIPPWVVLLLVLGWLLPSPNEIGRWLRVLFKKN